jgi:uncharacterized protein (DUF1330 family)
MAAYIVATVRITNPEKFGEYTKAIAGLSEQHDGEYIVRGPITEVLEGDIDLNERVIVSRFPDADAARAYALSPEYEAAARLREGAGIVQMRLIVQP